MFILDKNKKLIIDDRAKFTGSGFDEEYEIGEGSIAYQIIPLVKNVIEIGGGTGKVSHIINSVLSERNLQKKHIVIEPGLGNPFFTGKVEHIYKNKDCFNDKYTIISKLADELLLEDIQNVFKDEKPDCLFVDCEGCLYSFQNTIVGKYVLDNVKYIINEMDGYNESIREQWESNGFKFVVMGYGCGMDCTTEVWVKSND